MQTLTPQWIAFCIEHYGIIRPCSYGWANLELYFPPDMKNEADRMKKTFPHSKRICKQTGQRGRVNQCDNGNWHVGWGMIRSAKIFAVAHPYLCPAHQDVTRWAIQIFQWREKNRKLRAFVWDPGAPRNPIGVRLWHKRRKFCKELYEKRLKPACSALYETCSTRNGTAEAKVVVGEVS